jgi:predicted CopG family antitoxin
MPKPVMLSDEAYRALKAAKREGESFSDVILRKFPKGDPARILAVVKGMKPNPDLAKHVKEAEEEMRKNLKMREVKFD